MRADEVERTMRRLLAAGEWPVGARLPSERALARQFGVARNTVRRVVASLAGGGLLTASAGRGAVVCGIGAAAASGVAVGQVAPADAIEVRLLIEPQAAALAATRATDADYAAIEAAFQASRAADGYAAFEACDAALHAAIIAASRNGFLVQLYRIVAAARDEPRWAALKRRTATPERRALYDSQHDALVAALRERDIDGAIRAMQVHLQSVQTSLLAHPPAALEALPTAG